MQATLDILYGRIQIGAAAQSILASDDLPEYGAVVALPPTILALRTSSKGKTGSVRWRCRWADGPVAIVSEPGVHRWTGDRFCVSSVEPVEHEVVVGDVGSGAAVALGRQSVQRKQLQALVEDGAMARWEYSSELDRMAMDHRMLDSVVGHVSATTPYHPDVGVVETVAGRLVYELGLADRLLAIHDRDPWRCSLQRRAVAKLKQELRHNVKLAMGDPSRGDGIRRLAAQHPDAQHDELIDLYARTHASGSARITVDAVQRALAPVWDGDVVEYNDALLHQADAPALDDHQRRCERVLEALELDEVLLRRRIQPVRKLLPGYLAALDAGMTLQYWLGDRSRIELARVLIAERHAAIQRVSLVAA